MRHKIKKERKKRLHYTKLWKRLVSLAIIAMIISIILEFFFSAQLGQMIETVQIVDIPISLFLITDIALHYQDAKNKKKFIKSHALEIIAVLPLAGMFVIFKSLRVLPIIAELPLIAELTAAERIIKIEKSFKFLEGLRELFWLR